MSIYKKLAVLCMVTSLISVVVEAKPDEKSQTKDQEKAASQASTKQVQSQQKGKYSIDEDAMVLLFGEPDEHLVKARNALARKDIKEAALEVRKAIVFIRLESARAVEDNDKNFKTSIQELEKFISDLDKSTMSVSIRKVAASLKSDATRVSGDSAKALQISGAELEKLADQMEETVPQSSVSDVLDPPVARTHLMLVRHHLAKSRDFWNRKDSKRAGYDLDASAEHLARTYQWLNKDADGTTKTVFKDVRAISTKLSLGAAVAADEFTKAADSLNKEIDRTTKLVENQKK